MGYLDDQDALALAASDDIFAVGDTSDLNPVTGKRIIKRITRDNIFGQDLAVTGSPSFVAETISGANGIDFTAAGVSIDMLTVTGSGAVLQWDNASSAFYFNKNTLFQDSGGANTTLQIRAGAASFAAVDLYQGGALEWGFGVSSLNKFYISESGVGDHLFVLPGGDVVIGANNASAQLHIDQSSGTGAQPVLLLDQGDDSEEFIEFTATIGAGDPIDTAALGAYYGKIRVTVTGVGYKTIALYDP